jgi:hypothetical protein
MQSARKKGRLVEPVNKLGRVTRRKQHIEEERRVSLGQFSQRWFRPLPGWPGGE